MSLTIYCLNCKNNCKRVVINPTSSEQVGGKRGRVPLTCVLFCEPFHMYSYHQKRMFLLGS
jgi:hypothetical protein